MDTNRKSPHPAWTLEHRRPGTELRHIKGKYYLYAYKTVYDKANKKPKKISGKLLGSITEKNGFILSPKRKLEESISIKKNTPIQCKEYGVSCLVSSRFKEYQEALETAFPEDWKYLLAIAYCRFIYRCPLKNIPHRLASSFLPEILGLKPFNEKDSSAVLNRIGGNRAALLAYMKSFITPGDYLLMDATNVLSHSTHLPLVKGGYDSRMNYGSYFNLMYLYSANSRMPVYYRLLPGNIREVKAFKNSITEAGLKKAIIVADKGFYSASNIQLLQDEGLEFVLPLKRSSSLVDYTTLTNNTFKESALYFKHEERFVWYKKYLLNKTLSLCLYVDESLRAKEENDYVSRIATHPESYSLEGYRNKRHSFGTIALLTNVQSSEQDVYQTYKSRMAIEVMFDGMKNILEADRTYMQNEQTLQGWMFINHITLQWYQHLYIELKEKKLLNSISVNDYIQLLTDVKKICINGEWYLNEFTTSTHKLIDKLGIDLHNT